MKARKRLIGFGLAAAMAMVFCATPSTTFAAPLPEDLAVASKYNLVGTLEENFDGIADIDALYAKENSGTGVLAGKWQLTQISHVQGQDGKFGSNEIITRSQTDANKVLNMLPNTEHVAGGTGAPGGVDFKFNNALAPNCILDISYDVYYDQSDANIALTTGNYTNEQSIDLGHISGVGKYLQFFKSNDAGISEYATHTMLTDGDIITVKGVFNLSSWTYDVKAYKGETVIASLASKRIGARNGNQTCSRDNQFEKLTIYTPNINSGKAWVDNISVKAYQPKADCYTPVMSETFTGKTVGENAANKKVESGAGSWGVSPWGGSNYTYAEYTNKAGETDIGITAHVNDGIMDRLPYASGLEFDKMYSNSELKVKFDFVTPDADPISGDSVIMEWGDGLTNEYRNIPFFVLHESGGKWCLTRTNTNWQSHEVNDIQLTYGSSFVTLEKNKIYSVEATTYPLTEMTYITIKDGDEIIFSGFYRNGQWRDWTDGINIHTMCIESANTNGIIFDNFEISAKQADAYAPLGKIIDFNEGIVNVLCEVAPWGYAAIVDAPKNGETDMGKALSLTGAAEGVAVRYFDTPVSSGIYRYSTMLYNENIPVPDDESGASNNSQIMIDAQEVPEKYEGSLPLVKLENNSVSLGKENKIAVKPNEWVSTETVIDFNNKKLYLTAYDKDGNKLGMISEEFFSLDDGYPFTAMKSVRVRDWSNSNDAIVDNMCLEQIEAIPGFSKDGNIVMSLTENDNLKVGILLNDIAAAPSTPACIIAFYDECGTLISANVKSVQVAENSRFCATTEAVTVPQGAASAKAFAWNLDALKPLSKPVSLP